MKQKYYYRVKCAIGWKLWIKKLLYLIFLISVKLKYLLNKN